MKRTIFHSFLLMLIAHFSIAQRYMPEFENEGSQKLLEKAEKAYVRGSYERSVKFYDDLIVAEGESYELIFNKLTALVHTTDTVDIEESFKKLSASPFLDCNYLSIGADFKTIKYRTIFNAWKNALEACQQKETTYVKDKKLTLPDVRTQLLWMKTQDVESDVKVVLKVRYGGHDEMSYDSLKQYRADIYKVNFEQLLSFIEKYGWPGKSAVGEDGAEAAWIVAQHADHAPIEQAKLLTKLKVAVDAGEATLRQYAYLFDQVCANYRQPQRYGTLRWKNPETNVWETYPLEDPEKVNELRKEAGLPPLK